MQTTDKDTQAIFAIRKAREALDRMRTPLDAGDEWADWMIRAAELVGVERVAELADSEHCNASR